MPVIHSDEEQWRSLVMRTRLTALTVILLRNLIPEHTDHPGMEVVAVIDPNDNVVHINYFLPASFVSCHCPSELQLLCSLTTFYLHLFQKRTFDDKWHRDFTGEMSFLSPNQQCQSTEGDTKHWPPPVAWPKWGRLKMQVWRMWEWISLHQTAGLENVRQASMDRHVILTRLTRTSKVKQC